MAFETRKGRKFYYISRRVNRRVVKDYFGSADEQLVRLVAVSDVLVKQERQEAAKWRAMCRDAKGQE